MLNKKSFFKRTIIGFFISIFMIGMVLLDILWANSTSIIDGRAINSLLIGVLIIMSVVEMRRALGTERIPNEFSWIIWSYAIGLMPSFMFFGYTGIVFYSLFLFALATVTALLKNKVECLVNIAFVLVYPGLFMASLLYINRCGATQEVAESVKQFVQYDIWSHMGNRNAQALLPYNAIGLALVFAVSSFTDIFAYLVGSIFGKHKLCPEISPNKTVEGAIGAVFGGVVGAFIVFFIFDFGYVFGVESMQFVPKQFALASQGLSKFNLISSYLTIGIMGSIMTQLGDLLASLVKRMCKIKDYSHVLGEHGGIMDRFDGIMLNAVFVSIVYMFII